jgi:hypothetical protein
MASQMTVSGQELNERAVTQPGHKSLRPRPATDGFSATAMAYSNTWTTTEQEPLRAIQSGLNGLYGEIDPTDGGDTSRYSLPARMAQSDDSGSWKANAYVVKYEMDLFNDFTWFLTTMCSARNGAGKSLCCRSNSDPRHRSMLSLPQGDRQ